MEFLNGLKGKDCYTDDDIRTIKNYLKYHHFGTLIKKETIGLDCIRSYDVLKVLSYIKRMNFKSNGLTQKLFFKRIDSLMNLIQDRPGIEMTNLNAMPTIPPKDTAPKYKEIVINVQDEDTSVNLISKYNEYIAKFGLEKNHEDLNSIIALAQKLDASCNYIVHEDSIEVKADEGITTSIIGYYFINKVISKQNEC